MGAGDEAQNIVDISSHAWCSWRLGFVMSLTSAWPGREGSSLGYINNAMGVGIDAALTLEGIDRTAES